MAQSSIHMKKTYRLDGPELPTLVTPHDCIIREIKRADDLLVFVFEEDISYRDSIKFVMPAARSLIIRYHLTDTYEIYYQRWNKLFKRLEYLELKNENVLFSAESQYLYEYLMYGQLIIKLFSGREYMLTISADYVEYEWIEE